MSIDVEKLDFFYSIQAMRELLQSLILKHEPVYNGRQYYGWSILSDNGDYKSGFHHGSSVYQETNQGTEFSDKKFADLKSPNDLNFNQPTSLCQGIFKEIIDDLKKKGFYPCRARITTLPPGAETNWHRDHVDHHYWTRLHLPILTNEDCFFITERSKTHLAADGHPYLVKTNCMHQAVNAGLTTRYHLIMQVWDTLGYSKHFKFQSKERRFAPEKM